MSYIVFGVPGSSLVQRRILFAKKNSGGVVMCVCVRERERARDV